jgi:hypothetical protein
VAIPNEIRVLESVELCDAGERDEYLEIKTDAGWTFVGVTVRNTYVESAEGQEQRKLAYLLQPGAITRWWGGFGCPVHQIEVLVDDRDEYPRRLSDDSGYGDWIVVWDCTNDFQTLEESNAAADAYAAFIEREGDAIASRIDAGESPETAYENMDGDHSGNTAAWAWSLGCARAKDERRAQEFRDFWNQKWAPDQDTEPGKLVNPAVLHVGGDA